MSAKENREAGLPIVDVGPPGSAKELSRVLLFPESADADGLNTSITPVKFDKRRNCRSRFQGNDHVDPYEAMVGALTLGPSNEAKQGITGERPEYAGILEIQVFRGKDVIDPEVARSPIGLGGRPFRKIGGVQAWIALVGQILLALLLPLFSPPLTPRSREAGHETIREEAPHGLVKTVPVNRIGVQVTRDDKTVALAKASPSSLVVHDVAASFGVDVVGEETDLVVIPPGIPLRRTIKVGRCRVTAQDVDRYPVSDHRHIPMTL